MNTKRYELLNCQFNGPQEIWAERYSDEFLGLGNYPGSMNPRGMRTDEVKAAIGALAMYHLGYKPRIQAEEVLERGFDVAVDYFCGDWWKDDEDSARAVDKVNHRDDLDWFNVFWRGLLLGLLSERWDDLAKMCAWVESDLQPEYSGGDYEDELVHVYRSIAASLRPELMPGLEEVEASIEKCRRQRPKLLFKVWKAAREGDQPAFETAFLKALKHFEKNFDPEDDPFYYAIPADWIAPHHSVVGLAARRLGMALPELTPKQDARIITRESLGWPSAINE